LAALVALVWIFDREPDDNALVAQVLESLELPGGEIGGLLSFSPGTSESVVTRGSWQFDPKEMQAAEKTLRAGTMSVPRYNALGYLRLQAGQYALAEQSYSHALALDSDQLEASLGQVVARLAQIPPGDPGRVAALEEAQEQLTSALAEAPVGDPALKAAFYSYILILDELGMEAEAASALGHYARMNPPESWLSRLTGRLSRD
jgi:tetratricopeptide (TPR) repeat protein